MIEVPYKREAAVAYARRWALGRNPTYYDFERIGGDCTNFASQCIYAGTGIMNYTEVTGWYYRSLADRSAAWSSVKYLHKFLTENRSLGPYGQEVGREGAEVGDIVQLGDGEGRYYHSPIITAVYPRLLVSAHSYDALDRPLSSYSYGNVRFIHILGARIN